MDRPTRVALIGFSRFERASIESFFRLAARRNPPYEQSADAAAADWLLVDADDDAAWTEVLAGGAAARAVVLGAKPRAGARAQLARPINLMLVMRALDALPRAAASAAPPAAVAPPVAPPAPVRQAESAEMAIFGTRPITGADLAAAGLAAVAAPPRAAAPPPVPVPVSHAPTMPMPMEPPGPGAARLDHILVVDDSDIALRFMANLLQRFGFQIHLARSGVEAIRRVQEQHFEFVFLDVMMEGIDGFQTCKSIKRADWRDGRQPPTIVMLTSRGSNVDRLRGTMAGADAYLTKPLVEAELLKIIGDREVLRHEFAPTAPVSTLL